MRRKDSARTERFQLPPKLAITGMTEAMRPSEISKTEPERAPTNGDITEKIRRTALPADFPSTKIYKAALTADKPEFFA